MCGSSKAWAKIALFVTVSVTRVPLRRYLGPQILMSVVVSFRYGSP